MKKLALIAATTLGFGTTAFAGEPSTPVVATVPMAAPVAVASVTDWSGFYAGTHYSDVAYTNQNYSAAVPFGPSYDGSGSMYGLFAGYNFQRGSFVYGGELAYSFGEPELDGFSAGYYFSGMLDVKARAGYAVGSFLPYAAVGYSTATWNNFSWQPISVGGISYGVGVDYQVTNSLFVGAEYLVRDLVSEDFNDIPNGGLETDFSTISVRVGYTF